jgi:hypothetical protein
VKLETAFTGSPTLVATRIRVPWGATGGLFLFDQFGGAAPYEITLPEEVEGQLPDLVLTELAHETAFLAQRWTAQPIASWRAVATLSVDSASICVTTRKTAQGITGEGLLEADDALQESETSWLQTSLDGQPVLGVRISGGDGDYTLRIAEDGDGSPVGWVLHFGIVSTS